MKSWLLDVYPTGGDEMVICLKGEDEKTRLFRDSYTPEFYVHGSSGKLEQLEGELNNWDKVKSWSHEEKRVRLRDLDKSVAAENLDRNWVRIELEERWYEVAEERIAEIRDNNGSKR